MVSEADLFLPRSYTRTLAVRIGSHDQAVHCFQAPALPDEFASEPVEQFRMGWSLAQFAEAAERADNAATEMVFPHAIDHDSGGKRILGIDEPASEGQPASSGVCAGPRG